MALNVDPEEKNIVVENSQVQCGAEVSQEVFCQVLQSLPSEFLMEGICILMQY
jgi:hypothetical protein